MFPVASASPISQLRVSLRPDPPQVSVQFRTETSSVECKILEFPVASASENGDWQSIGQAASNVLRHVRARLDSQQSEQPVKCA